MKPFYLYLLILAAFCPLFGSQMQDSEEYFFAYGGYLEDSNLIEDLGYLPESLGVYQLENYEFSYSRAPIIRRATGGNIQPVPGKSVFGVVWKVKKGAFDILDKEEQAPLVYTRHELTVTQVDPPYEAKKVQVYIANPGYISPTCFPRKKYVNDMVLKGAHKHHLPKEYIDSYLRWSGPWGND